MVFLLASLVCGLCLAGQEAPSNDPLRDFIDQGRQVQVESSEKLPGQREVLEETSGAQARDEMPGVVVLSNGKRIPGQIFTTRYEPLVLYVEKEKRFRRIPLPALLSLRAVVVEEKMELEWRWKAMGVPERVYTGKKFPTRRLLWKVRLIDGTELEGAIKGTPLWVRAAGRRSEPLILHERQKGTTEQTLEDLLYVRRVLFSKKLMEQVRKRMAGGLDDPGRQKQDAAKD